MALECLKTNDIAHCGRDRISDVQICFSGHSLVKLDLSDNPMTAEMAEDLAETLRRQPNVRALILNDMSLTDEGTGCILEALKDSAPELEHLELALNEITPEGAKVVCTFGLTTVDAWIAKPSSLARITGGSLWLTLEPQQ